MIGVKEMCTLLLAGGMGAGSVVAVQQVKPAVVKRHVAPKPALHRASVPARPAPAAAAIPECPSQIVALSQPLAMPALPDAQLSPDLFVSQTPMRPGGPGSIPLPGGGGGGGGNSGGGGNPIGPVLPTVPEPASWAMLLSGFGLIGFALRRRPQPSAETQG